ncbi:MAG: PorT family protein [Prolixibacteraceae bacterium]|nr:PorT family protein [Prolixibacteraceae bacterium]
MRKLFFLFALTLISYAAFSQSFYGGLMAGFNGSQVEGDKSSGYQKMGFVGGAWTQTDVNEKVYWGLELKFNQKGSRINPTAKNGYYKYIYRLNYIDLPALAGYRINDKVSAFAGLSLGVLLSKSGYDLYGPDPTIAYSALHNWELGMLAGIKVDFDQILQYDWARKFVFDIRFQYSMLSIYQDYSPFFSYYTLGQFNNMISMTLFYRIDFGR